MLQDWLVVSPSIKFYTVSDVLSRKYGGENFAATNSMAHFYMFVPTKATVKLANGNTWHAQVIGIILRCFLTVLLYIWWNQFIIFQVTLPTPSHQVPSNFMLVLKRLHLNLLNIIILLTFKFVLGDHHTRLKNIKTIFKSNLSKLTPKETLFFLSQLSVTYQKQSLSDYSSVLWSYLYCQAKINGKKKTYGGSPNPPPDLEEPLTIYIFTKATKIYRGPTIDVSHYPLGSCFACILCFKILKESVDLPRILWLYVILLLTPLDFYPE